MYSKYLTFFYMICGWGERGSGQGARYQLESNTNCLESQLDSGILANGILKNRIKFRIFLHAFILLPHVWRRTTVTRVCAEISLRVVNGLAARDY